MYYLDNAATTKVHNEVIEVMMSCLIGEYGNANSLYYSKAVSSKILIDNARLHVAKLLGCKDSDVIFTSGSTEGNNMVIKSFVMDMSTSTKHFITSEGEHSSIIESFKFIESLGHSVTYLKLDKKGRIDVDQLICAFQPNTCLVSIMWVNNEVGSINPIGMISEICGSKGVGFHTDATQAVGKLPINLMDFPNISYVTISAHKFYGPKGIGAIYLNPRSKVLSPLIHGGEQERRLRGGTLPTHQIVGMGKAAEICQRDLSRNLVKLLKLEKKLVDQIINVYKDNIEIISDFKEKVPGLLSVRFKGVNNQVLLKAIAEDVAASSGAACSNSEPSHVLKSMGYDTAVINEVIRLSLSPYDDYSDFTFFQ